MHSSRRTSNAYAYEDRPLPIGHGQTISQPFIVALMTDLLNVEADDRVLEVGTGSGYQAAILASSLIRSIPSRSFPNWPGPPGKGLSRCFRTW